MENIPLHKRNISLSRSIFKYALPSNKRRTSGVENLICAKALIQVNTVLVSISSRHITTPAVWAVHQLTEEKLYFHRTQNRDCGEHV